MYEGSQRETGITAFPGTQCDWVFYVKPRQETETYGQLDERLQYTYGAIYLSPAVGVMKPGPGGNYIQAFRDKDGNHFDGANSYRLPASSSPSNASAWPCPPERRRGLDGSAINSARPTRQRRTIQPHQVAHHRRGTHQRADKRLAHSRSDPTDPAHRADRKVRASTVRTRRLRRRCCSCCVATSTQYFLPATQRRHSVPRFRALVSPSPDCSCPHRK
jgi:hypothetical protein